MNPMSWATKGILGGGPHLWLILTINQVPVKRRKGSGIGALESNKDYVLITFEYEGKTYKQRRYINRDINVRAEMLTLDVIDNKPIVKINLIETLINETEKPNINFSLL